MNVRLFFLRKEGWFEAEIAGKLKNAPPEEFIRWVYAMMDRHSYRNYLITENPECTFSNKVRIGISAYNK